MPTPRYRCAACGNLTRFDVTTTTTEKAYYHYSVGGELSIEDRLVIAARVDQVSCRWCGHDRAVEVLEDAASGTDEVPGELGA